MRPVSTGDASTAAYEQASLSLQESQIPLASRYDVALLDLDGVVYVGEHAVDGARLALDRARTSGMRLAFVTNNAARPPQAVAAHLTELGIAAAPDEVITSAQAAAGYLAERLAPGSKVLVVGATGLVEALRERQLVPVSSADDDPIAVVQGYSPTLDWKQLAEGAVAINRGALWVATNVDPTVPSHRGPLPGNGSLVAALRHATGAEPIVTGKPDPTMHRETVRRSAASAPIVVGDRLDTDIEGANAAGCPSLLVLTGVTSARELLAAPPEMHPTYVARDLFGLVRAHPVTTGGAGRGGCNGWVARVDGAIVRLVAPDRNASTSSLPVGDDLDPLRALCAAVWTAASQRPAAGYDPADERAAGTLRNLGLLS